jgi:hypothetical protein
VSFDVFIQAFSDGVAVEADADLVRAVVAPYITESGQSGFARLVTTDGGADLYGYNDLESGFMVNHISGHEAWDIVVQVAAASGLVVMPVGCPVALTDQDSFEHLPDALRSGEVAIVTSGSQLVDLVQERAWACPVCFEPILSAPPYATWPPEDLRALRPPYEDSLGRPSYEVCPSCGFEFGNDDNPGTAAPMSFEDYRRDWRADGRPLFSGGRFMPKNEATDISPPDAPINHQIQIVEHRTSASARWKCSCGESSGGRWSRSPQEALKAANRHLDRSRPLE